MKKRIRLSSKTTAVLNALADKGAGGATAEQLSGPCGIRPRQVGARLRWLQRGGFVRYVADQGIWFLTDEHLFNTKD